MTSLLDPTAQVATPSRSVVALNAAKWSKVVQKRACNKCDNYNRTNILAFGVPPIAVFCLSKIFSLLIADFCSSAKIAYRHRKDNHSTYQTSKFRKPKNAYRVLFVANSLLPLLTVKFPS
jgi:hypothetical protein